jgi:probable F420-dependent oxidoreductase
MMAGSAGLYGLFTPILFMYPGAGAWQEAATWDDLVQIAVAADRLGFDHLTCGEHIGIPTDVEAARGGRYFDPLATFGFLGAVTQRIRLATYVLVLGYNHPLEIAKRYGTLDLVTGGKRLVLGMGVGSLKPEFDLLGLGGAEFETRGARGDDALRALRAALGQRKPEYHGSHYAFDDFIIDPCAPRQDIPIWIGGRSGLSLRRAVELAEGWSPFGSLDDLAEMLKRARDTPAWEARVRPLEVVFRHEAPIDPIGAPEAAAAEIRRVLSAGATKVNLNMPGESVGHYVELLEALAALEI